MHDTVSFIFCGRGQLCAAGDSAGKMFAKNIRKIRKSQSKPLDACVIIICWKTSCFIRKKDFLNYDKS